MISLVDWLIGFGVHLMANCRTLWINKRCLVESHVDVIGQNTMHCLLANRELAICTKHDVNCGIQLIHVVEIFLTAP